MDSGVTLNRDSVSSSKLLELAELPHQNSRRHEDTTFTTSVDNHSMTGGDSELPWSVVLQEERACIDSLHNERWDDGTSEEPFSLAFSGGGMRAAAFQAGVLWRLAQSNALKDVEYIAAVSGGGYIASAYASHCLDSKPPEKGKVKEWYLDVVARTICRMQLNAGNFVRDSCKKPGCPEDGAGRFPRICDIVTLLATLTITLAVNPIVFFTCIVSPMALTIELYFGSALRAAFCNPSRSLNIRSVFELFCQMTPLNGMLQTLAVLLAVHFVVFVSSKCLGCCQLRRQAVGNKWHAGKLHIIGHGANAFLARLNVFMMVMILFLCLLPIIERAGWEFLGKAASRVEHCQVFVEKLRNESLGNGFFSGAGCIAEAGPNQWFDEAMYNNYTHIEDSHASAFLKLGHVSDVFTMILFVIFCLTALLILCIPILGSSLIRVFNFIIGPLMVSVLTFGIVKYCVFHPVTGERLEFDAEALDEHARWSLTVALITVPLYEEIRSIMHWYYKRGLQANFFSGGKSWRYVDLASNPYCPFVVLNGTSSDYQPPGGQQSISEVFFSPLHCGGKELGYIRTPSYRSLAKCTALTAAGCLDAISLSMADTLSTRFWLEVLNLAWGDYIMFERFEIPFIDNMAKRFGSFEGTVNRALHRIPSAIFWVLFFLLLSFGYGSKDSSDPTCAVPKRAFTAAGVLFLVLMGASFLSSLSIFSILALSPLTREIHQATRYMYIGNQPPRMIYVTDGGVKDCTGLVQLMHRRCKRILLVLAAFDPRDELVVLVSAMAEAEARTLGTFYNPVDPRLGVQVILENFKKDKRAISMHIGICYSHNSLVRTGHLFIVKNRLPTQAIGSPVMPLLTPELIRGERSLEEEERLPGTMTTDQLGSIGCCDCCHNGCLNFGPKFPHGNIPGYLYLTPQWCNGLIRLGHSLSEDVVKQVTREHLGSKWEDEL